MEFCSVVLVPHARANLLSPHDHNWQILTPQLAHLDPQTGTPWPPNWQTLKTPMITNCWANAKRCIRAFLHRGRKSAFEGKDPQVILGESTAKKSWAWNRSWHNIPIMPGDGAWPWPLKKDASLGVTVYTDTAAASLHAWPYLLDMNPNLQSCLPFWDTSLRC